MNWKRLRRSTTTAAPSGASRRPLSEVARTVRSAYHEDLDRSERAALLSWFGFSTTFSTARGITHSIKSGHGPFHDVSKGGVHLHHYLWGIAMLAGVGAVAVHGADERRRHPAVALAYGIGLGLIIDEFALLVDLEDVYWSRPGRISVEVGVGAIAAGGTVLAALPILQRLRREHIRGGGGADAPVESSAG